MASVRFSWQRVQADGDKKEFLEKWGQTEDHELTNPVSSDEKDETLNIAQYQKKVGSGQFSWFVNQNIMYFPSRIQ